MRQTDARIGNAVMPSKQVLGQDHDFVCAAPVVLYLVDTNMRRIRLNGIYLSIKSTSDCAVLGTE